MESAWLDDGARRLIARLSAPRPAESAVTRLIQGVWEREPEQARRIVQQTAFLARHFRSEILLLHAESSLSDDDLADMLGA